MDDISFKNHISSFANLIETDGASHEVKSFVVDTRAYHFVMNLNIQEWHDKEIIPRYLNSGIKKIAFCLSGDLIRDLSIEQTFDESQAQSDELSTLYFQDLRKALAWAKRID
ncbi:hypothetical protein [Flammeovirga sp. EKP202]|uniref:hypothetical protein n=1 Tax=Flammeovirga sp. EKP202 TaxID=2770592 RepID=UPI00165F1F7D|nr:hypothetical protein [Flammeovirga sp. EKP202]MBD0400814.1 hypothetical protein [Flammeovirga sp. EKP202]